MNLCSNCAQRHNTPAHSGQLQPNLDLQRNLGQSEPERVLVGLSGMVKAVS